MSGELTTLILSLSVATIGLIALSITGYIKRRWRDPRRLFTWKQKKQLIAQANGRCEHKPLLWFRCSNSGREADHIMPWSKGGVTQLWNAQLLCRKHNRGKSNLVPSSLYRRRLKRLRRRYTNSS